MTKAHEIHAAYRKIQTTWSLILGYFDKLISRHSPKSKPNLWPSSHPSTIDLFGSIQTDGGNRYRTFYNFIKYK